MRLKNITVAPLLCFEALFEEVARAHADNGAEVLAILSLDDWYQNTGAIDCLRAAAVLRAVENRLPTVRSAPLGPSMIVDAKGNVLSETKPRENAAAQSLVHSQHSEANVMRALFPYFALVALLALCLFPVRPTNASQRVKKKTPS
jgi:apolipoprotein N-acyltransferase